MSSFKQRYSEQDIYRNFNPQDLWNDLFSSAATYVSKANDESEEAIKIRNQAVAQIVVDSGILLFLWIMDNLGKKRI